MIQARRSSSHFNDSQELPADLVKLVKESINEAFGEDLPPGVEVSGRIFKEEILVRVGWPVAESGLRFMNVEASVDFDSKVQNATARIHVCLDALQASMEEFIEAEGDLEIPRFWTEFTFEKQKVFIQFSRVNAKLEDAADAFLKDHGFLEDGSLEARASELGSLGTGTESLGGRTGASAAEGFSRNAESQRGSDAETSPNEDENLFDSAALRRAKLELESGSSGNIH